MEAILGKQKTGIKLPSSPVIDAVDEEGITFLFDKSTDEDDDDERDEEFCSVSDTG